MTTSDDSSTRSPTGYDLTPLRAEERERLAARLSPEQRRILLEHGTERAFCGTLLNNKSAGAYACKLCGLPLFRSDTKFESGSGWPSFDQPFDRTHIAYLQDASHGMVRTEIRCARCAGHLGHVFPDGPPPTNERYCLNSEALDFFPEGETIPQKGDA
jgi:peptide-methionine (R)-S-oxide reductase